MFTVSGKIIYDLNKEGDERWVMACDLKMGRSRVFNCYKINLM